MTADINFKILYSFLSSLNDNQNYIIEIKRLDLSPDSPLNQKFRWLLINTNDIVSLEFLSMKKFTSNDDETKQTTKGQEAKAEEDIGNCDNIKWNEYRQFKPGEFYFNMEKGEFRYGEYGHKDNLNLSGSEVAHLPTKESTSDNNNNNNNNKIQYMACPSISIDIDTVERIKTFLKSN